MKSLSKITLFAALTAVTATACQKEDSSIDTSSGKLVKMTFTAGNPEFKPEVRTEIDGLTPYWSVGDQIGISTDGTKSNYPFTNDATERAATTTFSGNANISSRIYAYYPFTANGIDKVGQPVRSTAKPTSWSANRLHSIPRDSKSPIWNSDD